MAERCTVEFYKKLWKGGRHKEKNKRGRREEKED